MHRWKAVPPRHETFRLENTKAVVHVRSGRSETATRQRPLFAGEADIAATFRRDVLTTAETPWDTMIDQETRLMSEPTACQWPQLLQKRRDYCRALVELARDQAVAIEDRDYVRLLVVLGRRQRIIGRLDELTRTQPQLAERWQAERGSLEPQERRVCEELLAETQALLAELRQRDDESIAQLTQNREQTRQALQEVTSGGQVHQAYRDAAAPSTHRHLDIDR